MRASAISEPKARGGAGLRRGPIARPRDAHDHQLAFLELATGHLGVGPVADAELQGERGGLAVGAEEPHPPPGRSAATAASAAGPSGPRGPLALGGLDA